MSNQYAKCESKECEKYKQCARAQSTSTAIVNYFSMCRPEEIPFQWFIQGEVAPETIEVIEQKTEEVVE